MEYIVFDDMTQCTEADVERLLPSVSPERKNEALKYKHLFGRWACLKTYELWQSLMQTYYLDRAYPLPQWLRNEYGKPYITGGPYFSISHCKQAVAVAIDDNPVGIDVESVRHVDEALIERVMNETERQLIHSNTPSSPSHSQEETFTRLWTQKEAVLKLRGTGIIDSMQDVLTENSNISVCSVNHTKGYVLSIATTTT